MRIVFLTFDPVGARLAGSAIRVLEMGRALSEEGFETVVLTPFLEGDAGVYPFSLCRFDPNTPFRKLAPLFEGAGAVVLPLYGLVRIPGLSRLDIPLVFDLYSPFLFELVVSGTERRAAERRREIRAHCAVLNHALRRGDFFLCASERQRDMWLGALAANGRIAPARGGDECFRHLIDVVPLGIPPEPPAHGSPPVLKGVLPSIQPEDKVIVSFGALWEWQDSEAALRAMARVAARRRDIHLVLFAAERSAPGEEGRTSAEPARALAARLGLLGRQVHFLEEWIPYAGRGRYLAESDAGLTTHRHNIESRFSFRTRAFDYLWAGLPLICTAGDAIAEMVSRHELGIVVPAGDDEALAAAFERVAADPGFAEQCRTRIAALRPELTWRTAVGPLVRYCRAPYQGELGLGRVTAARELCRSAWRVFRREGLHETLRRARLHIILHV